MRFLYGRMGVYSRPGAWHEMAQSTHRNGTIGVGVRRQRTCRRQRSVFHLWCFEDYSSALCIDFCYLIYSTLVKYTRVAAPHMYYDGGSIICAFSTFNSTLYNLIHHIHIFIFSKININFPIKWFFNPNFTPDKIMMILPLEKFPRKYSIFYNSTCSLWSNYLFSFLGFKLLKNIKLFFW